MNIKMRMIPKSICTKRVYAHQELIDRFSPCRCHGEKGLCDIETGDDQDRMEMTISQ